jgi:pimeloyl-ACP methyl ester carboxylesterase
MMLRVVDGLHVETLGDGPDVVLVHGAFGWGRQTFAEQYALAEQACRLHVVDRRGYGASSAPDGVGWPVDVPDLVALLEELGGAHLVGHSYGGVDALLVAGDRPDLVRSLVVVEPPMYGVSEHPDVVELCRELDELAVLAPDMDGEQFFAGWADIVLGLHPRVVRFRINEWTDLDRIAADATRVEAMPLLPPVRWDGVLDVAGPRVVVSGGWPAEHRRAEQRPRGARAALSFQDTARVIAERLGVELVVFEESGHTLQLTDPQRFNALLLQTWSHA